MATQASLVTREGNRIDINILLNGHPINIVISTLGFLIYHLNGFVVMADVAISIYELSVKLAQIGVSANLIREVINIINA